MSEEQTSKPSSIPSAGTFLDLLVWQLDSSAQKPECDPIEDLLLHPPKSSLKLKSRPGQKNPLRKPSRKPSRNPPRNPPRNPLWGWNSWTRTLWSRGPTSTADSGVATSTSSKSEAMLTGKFWVYEIRELHNPLTNTHSRNRSDLRLSLLVELKPTTENMGPPPPPYVATNSTRGQLATRYLESSNRPT